MTDNSQSDKSQRVSGGSASAGASSTTTVASTTVTTKRTVEEYTVRRKRPWWLPLVALGTIPMAFWPRGDGDADIAAPPVTEVAVETTLASVETVAPETVAPETVAAETTVAPAPETTVAAAVADTTVVAAAGKPIPVVATEAGNFTKLTAAIGAAGLTDTLMGDGKFTVFAPTDEAFAKLPAGVLDALLKPENKDVLAKVLTYHLVSGETFAKDITAGDVETVEGDSITLSVDPVKANDATIITPDIPASNGVIHAIDTVLLPPGVDLASLVAAPATPESLTVYFANASSAIDGEAQAKIDGAVAKLKQLPAGTKVAIVGHASTRGNPERNRELSISRANNVKADLEKGLGADASKIEFTVDAKGDTEPDVDEAKSRKVTIEIQP
jgi:uncharacterized surface protein with fasciclin (FAS1) repeats